MRNCLNGSGVLPATNVYVERIFCVSDKCENGLLFEDWLKGFERAAAANRKKFQRISRTGDDLKNYRVKTLNLRPHFQMVSFQHSNSKSCLCIRRNRFSIKCPPLREI